MCRINNMDRCLKEFETDYRQRKYIQSLTFILVLFKSIRNIDTRANSLELL